MDSNSISKVSTWMDKGIINLIEAPFIPETSKEKAGGTAIYKRRLPKQKLLPRVSKTTIKTWSGRNKGERNIPGADSSVSWCAQEAGVQCKSL